MTSAAGIPMVRAIVIFVVTSALASPHHAQAEIKYFPIPAISTSKNDGYDFGLIVPALITGPDGDLKYLVAPMVVHNSLVQFFNANGFA